MNKNLDRSHSIFAIALYGWVIVILGIYLYQFKHLARPILSVLGFE